MIEWLDHGEIAIVFDLDDGEKRIRLKRPKFGQWGKIQAAQNRIVNEQAEVEKKIEANKKLSETAKTGELAQLRGTWAALWWEFVMVGDEGMKGLASEKPPPVDEYPMDLIVFANITQAYKHWALPLAPGETTPTSPIPTEPPPAPAPSTAPTSTS